MEKHFSLRSFFLYAIISFIFTSIFLPIYTIKLNTRYQITADTQIVDILLLDQNGSPFPFELSLNKAQLKFSFNNFNNTDFSGTVHIPGGYTVRVAKIDNETTFFLLPTINTFTRPIFTSSQRHQRKEYDEIPAIVCSASCNGLTIPIRGRIRLGEEPPNFTVYDYPKLLGGTVSAHAQVIPFLSDELYQLLKHELRTYDTVSILGDSDEIAYSAGTLHLSEANSATLNLNSYGQSARITAYGIDEHRIRPSFWHALTLNPAIDAYLTILALLSPAIVWFILHVPPLRRQ